MRFLLLNLLLGIIWAAATGDFSLANLVVGLIASFFVLLIAQRVLGPTRYFSRLWAALCLLAYFAKEVLLANLRVAYEIVTPTHYMRPGRVAIPLDVESDIEITLLSSMLALTPDTQVVDISDDKRVLYIHAMYIESVEVVRHRIKTGFERRIRELFA